MVGIAEPSYTIEYHKDWKQLIYVLSGPECDIKKIRYLIDDEESLGITTDWIWTPLDDTNLSQASKLSLINGEAPRVYTTADLIHRLEATADKQLSKESLRIILTRLNAQKFMLCDQHGENARPFDKIDVAIAAITPDLSHVRLDETDGSSRTAVVVVTDAQLPYPEVPGGLSEPSLILQSEAFRYAVYVIEPGEDSLDISVLQKRCTADWISICTHFPLPMGGVRMTSNDLKHLWLSDSVALHYGEDAYSTISEAIDLLLGKVREAPGQIEE